MDLHRDFLFDVGSDFVIFLIDQLPATCKDETEESTIMKKSISDNIHALENNKYGEEETEDDSEDDETEETEYHLLKEQEALLKNIKTVMKLQDKITLDKCADTDERCELLA